MEEGTTDIWTAFVEAFDLIKEELSLNNQGKVERDSFEKPRSGINYNIEYRDKNYKVSFNVETFTEEDNLDNWNAIRYFLRINRIDGDDFYSKHTRFRKNELAKIGMKNWLTLAFHERNLRNKPNLVKLLEGKDIRVISLPDIDSDGDFRVMVVGLAVSEIFGGSLEILRFRHAQLGGPGSHKEIDLSVSYIIPMNGFWAVFPFLGPIDSSSPVGDLWRVEKQVQAVNPDIVLNIRNFDFDKEGFMQYIMRNERNYRQMIPYQSLESSIAEEVDAWKAPEEIQAHLTIEIRQIDDAVWSKDYSHAIRDLRALIEDLCRALLTQRSIQFGEKDKLHELKSKLIGNKLIEGRLDSWFDAFASFGNKSAHENYPTKQVVEEDPTVRNRTGLTILLGKELIAELLNALGSS